MQKTDLPMDEVIRMYKKEKKTIIEIGKLFNKTPNTVYKQLKKAGIKTIFRNYKGYWDAEKVISKSKNIMEKYGELPSSYKLEKLGEGKYVSALRKYCGGMTNLRKTLRIDPLYKFYNQMTKEEYLDYGRKNNLDKLSRAELHKKMRGYYQKGIKKYWLDELIPTTQSAITRRNKGNKNSRGILEKAVEEYLENDKPKSL